MVAGLIFFNAVLSVVLGIAAFKRMKTQAALLWYVMHAIYFCLMPAMDYFFGFSAYGRLFDESVVSTYLYSGCFFLLIAHFVSIYSLNVRLVGLRSYVFKKIDSFQSTTRSRSTAILFFSLAIYFIAVAKNNDFIYFLNSGVNKFELMMSLKDGKYFLNFLSGGMLYVLLIVVSVYGKTKSSFSWLIVVMVFSYFFLAQPGTRTWALSLALSFFFLAKYPSIYIFGKTSILVLIVGFLSVIGLNVLNLVRLGQDVEVTGLIAKSFLSLYSNFLQYENALILISSFNDTGEWLKFRFLIASLSPFVVVPNILLPFDKPRADKEAFITESLFSSDLDLNFYSEGSTLTYTVPISGYADFGLFGVAVAALIYGLIISFFYYGMKYGRVSRLLALYGLVSFSAGYRLGVEGLMLLMYVFFIVLAVSFVFFKSRIRS